MNTPDTAPDGATPDGAAREQGARVETAGAFDIRIFIAGLIGIYGVILLVLGIVSFDAQEAAKTGGVNANLWTGLGLALVAIGFITWAKLDPIRMIVRDNEPGAEAAKDISPLD